MKMSLKNIDVLLVEDNPADVVLTEKAFDEVCQKVHLHAVGDGVKALEFLEKNGGFDKAPDPKLILMDLNLPGIHGHELLKTIRKNKSIQYVPIIMLSSSANLDDISLAYQNGANSYLRKPHDWNEFKHVVRAIEQFWLKSARLPRTN